MSSVIAPSKNSSLLERVTCPHCWESFPPARTLAVSEHGSLLGDPLLGPDEPQRFLPSRFNVDCEAVDAKGFSCPTMACPRCHLVIPRALLEMELLFMSIFGAPASGKSYLLASMTWELRQVMSGKFSISFGDADPTMNRHLNDYEESLFLNPHGDEWQPLGSLIRKTEEQGELYDTVSYGAQTISYPKPFLFSLYPEDGHPNAAASKKLGRVLCLYDNAGESFQPGKDAVGTPVTRHMAHSRVLFFVFDPTQDGRFRKAIAKDQPDLLGKLTDGKVARQEPVLQEAAARIRRYTKLGQTEKHNRPLVVILTKFDLWSHLIDPLIEHDTEGEPWKAVGTTASGTPLHALDVQRIERISQMARHLLRQHCPEIIAAAEGFARNVVYVPVSAVGWTTRMDSESGLMTVRPSETRPHWVTVPILYALNRWMPGLIPGLKRKGGQS